MINANEGSWRDGVDEWFWQEVEGVLVKLSGMVDSGQMPAAAYPAARDRVVAVYRRQSVGAR